MARQVVRIGETEFHFAHGDNPSPHGGNRMQHGERAFLCRFEQLLSGHQLRVGEYAYFNPSIAPSISGFREFLQELHGKISPRIGGLDFHPVNLLRSTGIRRCNHENGKEHDHQNHGSQQKQFFAFHPFSPFSPIVVIVDYPLLTPGSCGPDKTR